MFLAGAKHAEPRTCTEMSENNTENNQLSTAPSNGGESWVIVDTRALGFWFYILDEKKNKHI